MALRNSGFREYGCSSRALKRIERGAGTGGSNPPRCAKPHSPFMSNQPAASVAHLFPFFWGKIIPYMCASLFVLYAYWAAQRDRKEPGASLKTLCPPLPLMHTLYPQRHPLCSAPVCGNHHPGYYGLITEQKSLFPDSVNTLLPATDTVH